VGQLLVIITGGIDLSVASVMTLAGAIVVKHTQARTACSQAPSCGSFSSARSSASSRGCSWRSCG